MNTIATRNFIFFFISLLSSLTSAQDWPALRGPRGDGVGKSPSPIASSNANLKVKWKKKLGSGYSSVSIAGDSACTMYSSGEQDMLGCFDIKTGETKWEFPLDKRSKGENGSFDGPISTPLIHQQKVYGLSCQGRLVCVNVESGKLIWEKSLTKDFESKMPLYGFSTSPIMAAGNLILQVGATDKMIVAMDPKSGEEKWASGSDSISSQIPSLIEVDGLEFILASGRKKLTGLDPETGKVVFEFEHGGGNGSAVMPVAIGANTILVTVDDAFSKALKLRPIDDQKIAVSEQWQDRSIKNTYNIPTLCNENLFAFSTRILTCVDPETGKPHWKSRKPGDGFLIAVDNFIAIVTKEGSVHLATATKDKFNEVAKLKVFEDLVWTVPSFADGAIFIRSLGEIARIDIVSDDLDSNKNSEADALPMSHRFADFLKQVNEYDTADANKIVDEFIAEQTAFPIIDSGIAHFVYRGPENDVAFASDVFGARQERKMLSAGKSDLKYYTLELGDDQRANYIFLVNFKPQTDALNSRTTTSSMYAGEMEFAIRLRNEKPLEMSWFGMSQWKTPDHLNDRPESLAGKIIEHTMPAKEELAELLLSVYLPAGYDDNEKRYPVIYVFPHPGVENSQFIESADYLFSNPTDGIRPAIIVVPKGQAGPKIEDRLVPHIDKTFRTITDRSSRSAIGFGFSGSTVFGILASRPDLFGAISAQSPLVFDPGAIVDGMKNVKAPTHVYLDWGRFDMHNPVENWDVRKTSQEIFEALDKHEQITVTGGMANDSADWSSWKNRYDKILKVLTAERTEELSNSTTTETTPPIVTFTTREDHQHMQKLLGIAKLRHGPSGNPKDPRAANTDESKANPYPVLPHLMLLSDGTEVTTPELWWKQRRPEIVRAFESEVVGRIPENAPAVTWEVVKTEEKTVGSTVVVERQLNGKVDNSRCPEIEVNISMIVATPKDANSKVPVLMMFGLTGVEPWMIEFRKKFPNRNFGPRPSSGPSAKEMLIENGWGYATISPSTIQADKGEGLTRGIIGLTNKGQPRTQNDWGALRAWAWGASRGLDYLETDSTVDAKKVGIEGVSRFGKAALVTMAFDQRFATVLVGSSGEGGASLYRRNFGEAVENLTGSGEYHWMAGSFLKYGTAESRFGSRDANNLPVDSHQLIALCAPRPTFISYGIPEKGDALWLDQQGSFMAAIAAQPAFRLLEAKDLGRSDDYLKEKMPAVNTDLLDGHLAWRQHDGGHTDLPNIKHFIYWANKFL